MSQWSFALEWLVQGAIVSLAISGLGSVVVLSSSQPARRIHVITLTMIGCLAATLVGGIPGVPRWSLPWTWANVAAAAPRPQAEVPAVSGSRPIASASDQTRQPASAVAVRSGEGRRARLPKIPTPVAADGHAPPPSVGRTKSPEAGSLVERRLALSVHVPGLLVVLYLIGAFVMAAGWLLGMVWLGRVVRRASVADSCVQRVWRQIAGPNARPVRLLVSSELGQPIAFHLGHPTIVLPAGMEADADEQTLRWCLAHEQSHLEEGDWWIWTLSGLVRVVFFFQPLVWWLRRQLQLDQDYLADARAAEQSPEPEDYAEFLTRRASRPLLRPAVAGLGIGGRKSHLARRVIMLLRSEKTLEGRCPRTWRLGALVAALLAVGAVGTFGGVWEQDEQAENRESSESLPGAIGADSPAEALPAVARFDKPFPRQWMRWIFDEEVMRKSRESRGRYRTAHSPGDLRLSLTLWPGPQVTAGEVVIARLGITNPKETQTSLPFIGSIDEAVHFEVTDALGRPRGRAYAPPPWRTDGMVETFPPRCTKQYEIIVNHWYDFAEPGEYLVEARLVVADHLHNKEQPIVLSSQKTTVTVLPRDRQQLTRRCKQFFLAQRLGGAKQVPLDPAVGSDYRPSDYAARQALLHVTDEVVLPYLQLMLADFPKYREVVAAISYVDSPKVPAILEQLTTRGTEAVRKQAKKSLARLKAASEKGVQVEPSAPLPRGKPREQAGAEAPALKVSALVERLCGREGLALVAAAEVAEAETEVRVDPQSPVREVAAALNAAGLRAFDSAGGHALVILGPPDDAPAEDDSERYAVAYRLLFTLTPAQVEHQSEVGRFMGYVESKYLTKTQIEMAYTLLGYPAGGNRPRPPLDTLAVGLWPNNSVLGIRGADGRSLVVHVSVAPPPPAELLPEPLSGSVLWWYWPHAMSGQLDTDLVTVDPVQASLQEIVKLLTPAGAIALDAPAVSAATKPLFVAARSAPIEHLVWALEVATGLQAKAPDEDGRLAWRFVTDRYPRRADRSDTLLRLPSLGCGSPVEAPAAKALLAKSDERLAPVIAHSMKTLSAVARQPVDQFLPKPSWYGFSAETTYERLAEEGSVVLLWAPGMRLAIDVLEPDGSGGGTQIDLPAF